MLYSFWSNLKNELIFFQKSYGTAYMIYKLRLSPTWSGSELLNTPSYLVVSVYVHLCIYNKKKCKEEKILL